jgi:hypothetical protein
VLPCARPGLQVSIKGNILAEISHPAVRLRACMSNGSWRRCPAPTHPPTPHPTTHSPTHTHMHRIFSETPQHTSMPSMLSRMMDEYQARAAELLRSTVPNVKVGEALERM